MIYTHLETIESKRCRPCGNLMNNVLNDGDKAFFDRR